MNNFYGTPRFDSEDKALIEKYNLAEGLTFYEEVLYPINASDFSFELSEEGNPLFRYKNSKYPLIETDMCTTESFREGLISFLTDIFTPTGDITKSELFRSLISYFEPEYKLLISEYGKKAKEKDDLKKEKEVLLLLVSNAKKRLEELESLI